MKTEAQTGSLITWYSLLIVFVLIAGLAAFIVIGRQSNRFVAIKIDSKGTTRIGPIPLQNTNLRHVAFTAIGQLNNGVPLISVAKPVQHLELVQTILAMRQAGITSVLVHVEQSLPSSGSPIQNP
jgi:hypothetical protein